MGTFVQPGGLCKGSLPLSLHLAIPPAGLGAPARKDSGLSLTSRRVLSVQASGSVNDV